MGHHTRSRCYNFRVSAPCPRGGSPCTEQHWFFLYSCFSCSPSFPNNQLPTRRRRTASYAAIPVEAARAQNPVKSTPESLARAKKWWKLDCEMCHGKNGDGKGETARDMKLTMADFTDPATLKDHTDGEIF